MKKASIVTATLVLAAFALTAAASGKVKKHSLRLFINTEVNGVELKAGDYAVAVEDTAATFYRDGKEVAKTAVRTEEVSGKYAAGSLVYSGGTGHLTEIRLAGTAKKVVIDGETNAKAGSRRTPVGSQQP